MHAKCSTYLVVEYDDGDLFALSGRFPGHHGWILSLRLLPILQVVVVVVVPLAVAAAAAVVVVHVQKGRRCSLSAIGVSLVLLLDGLGGLSRLTFCRRPSSSRRRRFAAGRIFGTGLVASVHRVVCLLNVFQNLLCPQVLLAT